MDERLSVGELAAELGVTPRTIRFYEDAGLISPGRAGTARSYTARDRARMILILRGKRLGFSLRDVGDYLELYNADQGNAAQLALLVERVRARLASLAAQREALDMTIAELNEIERQAEAALATHALKEIA